MTSADFDIRLETLADSISDLIDEATQRGFKRGEPHLIELMHFLAAQAGGVAFYIGEDRYRLLHGITSAADESYQFSADEAEKDASPPAGSKS